MAERGRFRRHADDARSQLLQAIARTRQQQARVDAELRTVFVRGVQLDRALTDQAELLSDAAGQIRDAMGIAQGAAETARAEADIDPSPFELTAQGLSTQLDVVDAAIEHLGSLRVDAETSVEQARTVLRQNAAALDGALRAEVQLLGRLDRLERERVIGSARRRGQDGGATPG
jgi:chromosome segregation ATPase